MPRPPPNDARFYTVEDFNIGRELTLYGRVFKLTSCDEFTRNFLTKLGVRVPHPEGTPSDPYADHRKAVSSISGLLDLICLTLCGVVLS